MLVGQEAKQWYNHICLFDKIEGTEKEEENTQIRLELMRVSHTKAMTVVMKKRNDFRNMYKDN